MRYIGSTLFFYLSRIFWLWFGVAVLTLSSVIVLFGSLESARKSIGKSTLHFSVLCEMIVLQVPSYLQILLPFLILIAASLTFWRLNNTLELTIARASGLSLWQILGAFSVNILAFALLNLLVFDPIAAATTRRYEFLQKVYLKGQSSQLSISETGLWLREALKDRQTIMRSKAVRIEEQAFQDVTFFNFDPKGHYNDRIDARTAILSNKKWTLSEVTQWDKDNQQKKSTTLEIPTGLTLKKIQDSNASPQSFSFWQLPNFINMMEHSGISSLGYRLYWHSILAKIGSMIAMLLIAAIFMIRPHNSRQGKVVLFLGGSIALGFAFHFATDISYALGLGNRVPLILAVWAPSLVVILLSCSILLHFEDG